MKGVGVPQISLTDFVDVVSKAGRPKATKVRQIKERPDYEPALDFYKALRDHIVDCHKKSKGKGALGDVLKKLSDPKKISNYPGLIKCYEKWWGRKDIVWFVPPKSVYSFGGFDINLNPELGLRINGVDHVVKLYLKSDPLASQMAEIVIDLLESELRSNVDPGCNFCVLDVRKTKLHSEGPHVVKSIGLIKAELAYMASIWG
ncbi:hypothetical protein AA0N74_01440 [Chromobacterium vaccinii]|uniref:hypothetical protein n=1 Tax=Chromobacterium vaccinii TaxID=1108595 RepID=UPI0031DD80FE